MIRKIILPLYRNLVNLPGWRTKRKIVVIESDDWGSIRMPSLEAFHYLKDKGLDLTSGDALRYNLNDNLATPDDLGALFDVLSSHKDKNNKPCVFTPLCLVANPDFKKIKDSNFLEYHYEPFTETLRKQPGCEKSFDLWKQGMKAGIFMPQFHGREHLNVTAWMNALRAGDQHTHMAFEQRVWGFKRPGDKKAAGYQAAFYLKHISELDHQKKVLEEGLDLFEKVVGYKAQYFAPPNGFFNKTLEASLFEKGIKYINAWPRQKEPLGNDKTRRRFHYLGQENKFGQKYILRNALFEPNQPKRNDINECLYRINIAFRWNKPAVISTHRANYIGALNPNNSTLGLKELDKLLKALLKQNPDVEFMTTTELGELMAVDK